MNVGVYYIVQNIAVQVSLGSRRGGQKTVGLGVDPATVEEDAEKDRHADFDMTDPLDWLGRAAGYESGESWWNHMVEERLDGLELFDAIREAMTAVRQDREQRFGAPSGMEARCSV